MTKTIIYFTEDQKPSVSEAADIAELEKLTKPAYRLLVRTSSVETESDSGPEIADYYMGEIPDEYDDVYEEGVPEFDLDEPPSPDNLMSTQAVVYDGMELELSETVTLEFTVEDNTITGVTKDTQAIVYDGQKITLANNDEATITVVNGVVTAIVIAS
jgi:hypothetical protein